MAEKDTRVGGDLIELSPAEARSALSWWLEAGVDCVLQDEPRNWLAPPKQKTRAPAKPDAPNIRAPEPQTLEALKTWLATGADVPLAGANARRALPHGPEDAEIMLLCETPGADADAGDKPITGDAWALTVRMLAAIGIRPEQSYSASLTCFHVPGRRMTTAERELCAEIARRHIRLARPKNLLLFGDGPCVALLGKSLPEARGTAHKVEGVRAVATFHPRQLIQRPTDKALAWRDLLLLMEDQS
ncbi:MAG TPA: uracil-DNA glycosylase [Sphingomicrobium sp.]|nr:uracil-DNA glycosylase [Sphingomicrobium sp.]